MKNSFPTLDQIREIVRAEGKTIIAAFDRDLKFLEERINSVDDKVDKGFTEVGKRFDTVEDKIQSLDERLIVQSERVKKVEKSTFISP